MPASVTSVFSEPDDFQAALREEGVLSVLITGHGEFRARLTQVTLHRWRLWTSEEHLSRIALVAVPANAILVLTHQQQNCVDLGRDRDASGRYHDAWLRPAGAYANRRALPLGQPPVAGPGDRPVWPCVDRSGVRRSGDSTTVATSTRGYQAAAPPPCDRHPSG
jgi:hypothetical protein